METEEKSSQPEITSAFHSHLAALPASASASPSLSSPSTQSLSDTTAAASDASHAVSESAENKLDTADDEYVMVDRPTDDEMQPTDDVKSQSESTEEKQADNSSTATPGTPHKQTPAKRRSELESDLNTTPAISLSRSGRQRKPPTAFTPFAPSERPHVEQSKGQGTPLADIPNVVRRIDNSKSDSPEIRRFYSLCFPLIRPPPHKSKIKSVLKTFSGLTTDEQRHSAKGKLKRMWKEEKPPVLYRLMLLMDLDYVEGGEGVSVCHQAIVRWLDEPAASGREFQTVKAKYAEHSKKKRKRQSGGAGGGGSSKKKRKAEGGSDSDSEGSGSSDSDANSTPRKSKPPPSSSKKSKSKGGDGTKKKKNTLRTANSFVVFTSAKRVEVRAANPSMTAQEVTSKMAALWRELPPEEKEVYELAAKRLREDALREEEETSQGEGKKAPTRGDKGGKKSGSKKKKQKSAVEAGGHGDASDSEDASDSSVGTSDEDGSDSGTEDEDDVKEKDGRLEVTAGDTNGSSSSKASNGDNTASTVELKSESNASTPSNAANDAAMKIE